MTDFKEFKVKQEYAVRDEYDFRLNREEQMTLIQLIGILLGMAFVLVLLFLSAVV